jgi:hypothetical protein
MEDHIFMLIAVKGKSPQITSVEKTDDQVILSSEQGLLRIKPCGDDIIRVTYATTGFFSNKESMGITEKCETTEWSFNEDADVAVITTKKLVVSINKTSGSIAYFDQSKKLLLKEADKKRQDAYSVRFLPKYLR